MSNKSNQGPKPSTLNITRAEITRIDEEVVSAVLLRFYPNATPEQVRYISEKIRLQGDPRLVAIASPYLTWSEAKSSVAKLQNASRKLLSAIEELQDNQNPNAKLLLDQLRYAHDSRETESAGIPYHWLKLVAGMEDMFQISGGRGEMETNFIKMIHDSLYWQGLSTALWEGSPMIKFMFHLDLTYQGLVFAGSETLDEAETYQRLRSHLERHDPLNPQE